MTHAARRPRIGFISTSNYALSFFLQPYIVALAKNADVVLIANTEHGTPSTLPGITFIAVPFVRTPKPGSDLWNLIRLCKVLKQQNLDIVYTISPKGGLLGMLAATLMRVKKRVHFFTGQVWITRTGLWRKILKSLDKAIASMAHVALVDSGSQRDFLVAEYVLEPNKSKVLGAGSVAGIDTNRFRPDPVVRRALRDELNIAQDMMLLVFLGRVTRDKGVQELMTAFEGLAEKNPNLGLLIAGPDEGMMDTLQSSVSRAGLFDKVWFTGGVSDPERYFAAGDIFCLPSYREGFGLVIIEAAATGLPAIGSNIYGVKDAIIDGETGLLHDNKNVADLADKIEKLITDDGLRNALGQAALKRAQQDFSQDAMVAHFLAFHNDILDQK